MQIVSNLSVPPQQLRIRNFLQRCRPGTKNNSKGLYSTFPSGLPSSQILESRGLFVLQFPTAGCPETSQKSSYSYSEMAATALRMSISAALKDLHLRPTTHFCSLQSSKSSKDTCPKATSHLTCSEKVSASSVSTCPLGGNTIS